MGLVPLKKVTVDDIVTLLALLSDGSSAVISEQCHFGL